jgi:predicted dithiol-disulfide oxidoreductase (DUF899 family)
MTDNMRDELVAPEIVDRSAFQAELDALRLREKAHTHAGDAIAAARRRLPMVEVDGAAQLIGERGAVTLLDAFEGRRMLIAYYFMWHAGKPAPQQCEGCTWVTSQVRELSYIHARDVTFAVFAQGPYEESARYREFMGWEMPWYSALGSLETLLVGRRVGRMHLVCYLRQGSKVFETYWTTSRGVEYMDNSYRLLDLTVYGRQERFEDSPAGWPQPPKGTDMMRADGRPLAQWPRVKAGCSDDLETRSEFMKRQNFTTTISVDQSPEEAFAAINNVRGWWSGEIEGDTGKPGAEFTYRYQDVHRSKQKITEFIPGQKLVWHVSDSYLGFVENKSEWNGTDIVFEISQAAGKTEVRFTHAGLVPQYECYGSCSSAWGTLINGNLRKLITTGNSQPDGFA